MIHRDLIPKSPIGEELHTRFQEFSFRTNPGDSPMARTLAAHGYQLTDYPIHGEYTDTDWLASSVSMRGLKIVFRHPTPEDLLVCLIQRETAARSMASALVGLAEFFSLCRYECPGLKYVGGNINKQHDYFSMEDSLELPQQIAFYQRVMGYVESHEKNGQLSIYADLYRDRRYQEFPIWKRCRRKI